MIYPKWIKYVAKGVSVIKHLAILPINIIEYAIKQAYLKPLTSII